LTKPEFHKPLVTIELDEYNFMLKYISSLEDTMIVTTYQKIIEEILEVMVVGKRSDNYFMGTPHLNDGMFNMSDFFTIVNGILKKYDKSIEKDSSTGKFKIS
jgi:hypothetical protein